MKKLYRSLLQTLSRILFYEKYYIITTDNFYICNSGLLRKNCNMNESNMKFDLNCPCFVKASLGFIPAGYWIFDITPPAVCVVIWRHSKSPTTSYLPSACSRHAGSRCFSVSSFCYFVFEVIWVPLPFAYLPSRKRWLLDRQQLLLPVRPRPS